MSADNEQWYDAEIAPVLADLGDKCRERGMAFIAVVEYAQNERGATYSLPEGSGLEMHMIHLCSRSAPNVDSYIINLKRFAKRHGIDTSAAWALRES